MASVGGWLREAGFAARQTLPAGGIAPSCAMSKGRALPQKDSGVAAPVIPDEAPAWRSRLASLDGSGRASAI